MGCIFCDIVGERADASVVHREDGLLAFMDIYPMRAGHVLVIPTTHAQHLSELPDGTGGRIFELAARIGAALRASELACDDVNILVNDGRAANQTVAHVHAHVVPRVRGDLPRLFGKLLRRPLEPLLGGPGRAALDKQARAIARHLGER